MILTDCITPLTLAFASAPVPPPPVIETLGCAVYPLPPCSTRILVTLPPVITACAVAPLPLPPTIDTRGDSV